MYWGGAGDTIQPEIPMAVCFLERLLPPQPHHCQAVFTGEASETPASCPLF